MCGDTWNVHTGIWGASLPQIFRGSTACHVPPSPSGSISEVVQFKLYSEEANKYQNRLIGRRVVLGMEPKAWYMLGNTLLWTPSSSFGDNLPRLTLNLWSFCLSLPSDRNHRPELSQGLHMNDFHDVV